MTTNFFKLCNNYLSFCLLVSLSIKSKSESCLAVSDTLRSHEFIQSIKFSRPEHWGGKLFPSPEDLPNPGMEPRVPALQVDSLPTIREAHILSVLANIYCSFDSLVIFCVLSIPCWIYLLNFYFSCFTLQFKQFHLVLYTFYFFTDTFHFFVENFI